MSDGVVSHWFHDTCDRVPAGVAPFGLGQWDEAFGSHRAVVRVAAAAPAVCACLPWRRRDRHPETRHVRVVDAATGRTIENAITVTANREYGEVVFEPVSGSGTYYLYYLIPMDDDNAGKWPRWAFPVTRYLPPQMTAAPAWLQANGLDRDHTRSLPPNQIRWDAEAPAAEVARLAGPKTGAVVYAPVWRSLPAAELVEFQAISEWDSTAPMELIATQDERLALEHRCRQRPFLLFPESRRRPIRMTEALPYHWAVRTDAELERFDEEACRNEYFVFQLGLYALHGLLTDVRVTCSALKGSGLITIPAAAITCFNLAGVDQAGHAFRKTVHVESRRIQALWFGVDIPENLPPGRYEGTITVSAGGSGQAQSVMVALTVTDPVLADRGDGDAWRLSRLRWLNSRLGLDTEVCPPFTPIQVRQRTVKILGRQIELGDSGFPTHIASFIDMFDIGDVPHEALAAPVRLHAETRDGQVAWTLGGCACVSLEPGRAVFSSEADAGQLGITHTVTVEADGMIEHRLVVETDTALDLTNLKLELSLPGAVARYALGIGDRPVGGACPETFEIPVSRVSQFWIGDYNIGLGLRLPPGGNGWENHGTGRVRGLRNAATYDLVLETGRVSIPAAGAATFVFELYVTPFKPLPRAHWDWRYYQANYGTMLDVPRGLAAGARIFTQHHETPSNPFISYPFLTADRLKAIADQVHAAGSLFKFYYTIRELSVRAPELWALRSLGDEILVPPVGRFGFAELADLPLEYQLRNPYEQPFTGMPWMCEHLVSDYHSRWHSLNKTTELKDGSLQISGASRWSNFFVEGIRWLMVNAGLDGLYFDGITLDRESLCRVRKTLLRGRPQGLIDFHGTADQVHLLPFYDSLWFGEGANYAREPDYWLAVVSGIAFGVPGELLLPDAGVARGMVYGLCQRYGWMDLNAVDPSGLWKWWDTFGIHKSRMIGYWQADCPVRTDHPAVKATVYVRPGRALAIAVASWADGPVTVRLEVNWTAVGMSPQTVKVRAPEIRLFQPALNPASLDAVPLEPGKGWILEVTPGG